MIERLKPTFKGKRNLINLFLLLSSAAGIYLLVAWASYSPLDKGWSISNSINTATLNKTGEIGAWFIDFFYAAFGKVAVIVPLTLTFFSIYSLVMRNADHFSWQWFVARLSSFLLLMLGLTGLSATLFSNTASYLSGGFVGGMLESILTNQIGQFGSIFISMCLAVAGFIFCSGQSVLHLLGQFYGWITQSNEENRNTASSQLSEQQDTAENPRKTADLDENETPDFVAELAQNNTSFPAMETTENVTQSAGLTDVSAFSRPHISGLKSMEQNTMYEVEKTVELPNVNLPQVELNTFKPQTVEEPPVIEHDMNDETPASTPMPTVRLALYDEMDDDDDFSEQPLSDDDFQQQLAKEFADAEKARLAAMEQRAKHQGLEKTFNQIITTSADLPEEVLQPKVSIAAAAEETDIAKKEPKPTAYPKGYGETLIHPLLQRNTTSTERPTTPLPTVSLLNPIPMETQQITEQEIRETSARIEKELANFGVKATVEDVLVGPVVTRYEIRPAAGVKAAKITNLDSDLARALMFQAIRITEVVPGKPYMGIETPNKHRETVWLRDVLDSPEFIDSKATLPMVLGKDISGKPIIIDMAKTPHLLVAGQTGGGKSVGVNAMILSLLFKLTPEQLRFIMIDPKVVELSIYNDIPHLLTPVVTDMKKAANALRWAVEEMERRYLLISHLAVRNIEGYNAKIKQAEEMGMPIPSPLWKPGDTMDALPPPLEKLTYIVLVVDEFADLMISAGKQVEEYIMRIAQKARAVGMHLILATQRPSTDVITGVIKANIPSRIAFTVAGQVDSRTILDKGGAESLLGRGDMLYSGAGSPEIIRVHGAFMTDDEVERVADNWRARAKPQYLESIVESVDEEETSGESKGDGKWGDDPLFDEVVEYVIESKVTSISGIQRRFPLGFNRAARMVDKMEELGILSTADSRGKREVLAR